MSLLCVTKTNLISLIVNKNKGVAITDMNLIDFGSGLELATTSKNFVNTAI